MTSMHKLTLRQQLGLIIIRAPIWLMRLIALLFNLEVMLNVGIVAKIHIDDITDEMMKDLTDSQIAEIKVKRLLRKSRGAEA